MEAAQDSTSGVTCPRESREEASILKSEVQTGTMGAVCLSGRVEQARRRDEHDAVSGGGRWLGAEAGSAGSLRSKTVKTSKMVQCVSRSSSAQISCALCPLEHRVARMSVSESQAEFCAPASFVALSRRRSLAQRRAA